MEEGKEVNAKASFTPQGIQRGGREIENKHKNKDKKKKNDSYVAIPSVAISLSASVVQCPP